MWLRDRQPERLHMEEKFELTTCEHCWESFPYSESETFWDENFSSISIKYVKCPKCGRPTPIKYEFARWYADECNLENPE